MINPNNLSFWWCFFFPSRWFQTLPVGMPVPTALQGAVWYPLKSHRTPRSSKKAPSETWLPSILWLLGGVCSHNWPVTGQPSGNQCRGPAPADPGYLKRGRRRQPANQEWNSMCRRGLCPLGTRFQRRFQRRLQGCWLG